MPEKVSPVHRLMALDRALGMTNNAIAEKYDYSVSRIGVIFSMPLMKDLVAEFQNQIAQKAIDKAVDLAAWFDAKSPDAAGKIEDLMHHSEIDTVQLQAAKEILDRSPNAPKARKLLDVEARGVILQLPAATVENMKAAARIVGKPLQGEVIHDEFDDHFEA
jgi:hypothetical protein